MIYLLPIVFGMAAYWSYCVRNLHRELKVKEEAMIAEQEKAAKEVQETPITEPSVQPELTV